MMSCGVADIIATCFGGRNRRCGMAFAERVLAQGRDDAKTGNGAQRRSGAECERLWEAVESDLLGGQKLQGVDTCREVMRCLRATGHASPCATTKKGVGGGVGNGLSSSDGDGDGGALHDETAAQFPLFSRIHSIACEGGDVHSLFHWQ